MTFKGPPKRRVTRSKPDGAMVTLWLACGHVLVRKVAKQRPQWAFCRECG